MLYMYVKRSPYTLPQSGFFEIFEPEGHGEYTMNVVGTYGWDTYLCIYRQGVEEART